MKVFFCMFVGAAVLVAAGVAFGSHTPEKSDPRELVFGGGHIGPDACFARDDGTPTICLPFERDISLDAHAGRFGGADGTLFYGNNRASLPILRGEVTCLRVDGSRAAVGGWIRDAANPSFVGGAFFFYLVDNGGAGSAIRDRISPVGISLDPAERPAGFPSECPAPDGGAFGYTDLLHGDVAAHNVS